ncbi:X-linked retinitis pigmentosa GTPase regulator [Echinococcus granulosus]|uniref:Williams Beuren syndrome chromosomal region 16 n=1 Tax=Echinococcus granulosus TaxID=6210 RepID=A0A068WSW0_ECHGR|nr:X-linked retinitis pigmentosa GTPase regulator [Echinococcus granulosus]CDS23236.1 Williams Beuren syndrome chromosomal region 16 [Echinococcus granulosus]
MLVSGFFRFTGFSCLRNIVYRLASTQRQSTHPSVQDYHFSPAQSLRVYGFGVAATGALGIKRYVEPKRVSTHRPRFTVSVPTHLNYMLVNSIDVKSISCGYGFTIFICSHHKAKRAIYGCGINSDGQLGLQTSRIHGSISESLSIDVVPEPRIVPIPQDEELLPLMSSCGRAHSIIVFQNMNTKQPVLFSLGNNTYGQCAREIIAGEIFTADNPQVTRVLIPPELKTIKQIECGQDHSLVLSSEGQIFSAGLSTDGQTGLGSTDSVDRLTKIAGNLNGLHVKQISSRGDTVLALTECGRVFGWGNNEYSQIWSASDEVQVLEPTEIPIHQCLTNVRLGRITQVAAAGSMCGLLDEYGHVLVWGFGCLGLGPKAFQCLKPTLIPPALFSPALPFSDNRITDLVPGLHHFIARSSCGLLWSWGAPRGGLACLGLGRNSTKSTEDAMKNVQTYPMPLSLPAEALRVACGVDHTMVIAKSFV